METEKQGKLTIAIAVPVAPNASDASTDETGLMATEQSDASSLNFQEYWCVLAGGALTWKKDEQVSGGVEVSLEDSVVEIAPELRYGKKCCFELKATVDQKMYVVVAENSTEMQEWMTAIRRAMLRMKRQRARANSASAREERRAKISAAVRGDDARGNGEDSTANPISNPDSGIATDMYVPPGEAVLAMPEDRMNVYKQWLQESKATTQNKKVKGTSKEMGHNLLGNEDGIDGSTISGKKRGCGTECCVVS